MYEGSQEVRVGSIKRKLIVIIAASLVLTFLIEVSMSIYSGRKNRNETHEDFKKSLIASSERQLKNQVEICIGVLDKLAAEDRNRALETAAHLRYNNGSGYFFAYDVSGSDVKFAFHGTKRELWGKVTDVSKPDVKGFAFREKLIEKGKSGGGFVKYHYEKPGTNKIIPKLAYAKLYPDLNWVVVTGIYIDDIDKLVDAYDEKITEALNSQVMWAVFVQAVVVSLIVLLSIYLINRFILRPVRKINERIRNLSEGEADLTRRVKIESKGELAELAEWVNLFIERIQKLVTKVKDNVGNVSAASHEISSASEEVSVTIEDQGSKYESTRQTVQELTTTSSDIANSIDETQATAEKASELTRDGSSIINKSIESLEAIKSESDQLAVIIGNLQSAADKIGNILNVINDVSDQTNLLALNAAIEAARAGEAGRGFAVVADEVRKLAERTGGATKEIESIISELQSEASKASVAMENTTEEVNTGTSYGKDTLGILEKIINITTEILDSTTSVAAAITEENAALGEVNVNLTEIANSSTESTSSVNEIAKSTDDLARQTEELRQLVDLFNT